MITIRGNNITMNRSDSVFITVTIRDIQGKDYELQDGDKLYFAAKKKSTDANYAIAPKELVGNVLEITTADTEHLEFGTYFYDVKLVTSTGHTATVISPSSLIIAESITSAGDNNNARYSRKSKFSR